MPMMWLRLLQNLLINLLLETLGVMLNILVVSNISVYQFQENTLQWNVTVHPEIFTHVLPFCGGLSGSLRELAISKIDNT